MSQNRPVGEETFNSNMSKADNYFNWIYQALQPAIKCRLVEIGVGSAPFIDLYPTLEGYFPADIDKKMVYDAEQSYAKKQGRLSQISGIIGDASKVEFWKAVNDCQPDSIVAVNVLEHIEDDNFFVAQARHALLPRKGLLALFIPAMPIIYGSMDVAAGHYRRYTREGIRQMVLRAGFKIKSLSYFNSLGAVLWYYQGRIIKTKDLNDKGLSRNILLYDRFGIPITKVLDIAFHGLFGQSIVLIAESA